MSKSSFFFRLTHNPAAITRGVAQQLTSIHPGLSDHRFALSGDTALWNTLKEMRTQVKDGKVVRRNNAFDRSETRSQYLNVRMPVVVQTISDIATQFPHAKKYSFQEMVLPADVDVLLPFGETLQSLDPAFRWNFFMNDHGLAVIVPACFGLHESLTQKINDILIGGESMSKACLVITDGDSIEFHVHAPLAHQKEFNTTLVQLMLEHAVKNCLENNAPKKYSVTGDLNTDFDGMDNILKRAWENQCVRYLKENWKPLPCEFNAHGDISENGHLHDGEFITADAVWYFKFNPAAEPRATIERSSRAEVIALLLGAGFCVLQNPVADEVSAAAVLATVRNNTNSLFGSKKAVVVADETATAHSSERLLLNRK